MIRFFAALATFAMLAAPVMAQEGGSVFTNNPNELPMFLNKPAPKPDQWAGFFFHSQIRDFSPRGALAQQSERNGSAVN